MTTQGRWLAALTTTGQGRDTRAEVRLALNADAWWLGRGAASRDR